MIPRQLWSPRERNAYRWGLWVGLWIALINGPYFDAPVLWWAVPTVALLALLGTIPLAEVLKRQGRARWDASGHHWPLGVVTGCLGAKCIHLLLWIFTEAVRNGLP